MQETFGLKDEALLRASGALTGGIGGMGDTCGSLIGAVLVMGSVSGDKQQDDKEGMVMRGKATNQAADYYKWFKGQKGTVNCHDILTIHGGGKFYDFSDPKQAREAFEKGVPQKCDEMVANNAAKAAGIIWDEIYEE